MTWRVAKSILTILQEVNAAAPSRSRKSDGTIGDAAHATRSSDHNPWLKDKSGKGVVTAVDITHDPTNGMDAHKLAEHFRTLGLKGDPRIKFVISNQRIASALQNWVWRYYGGSNPHRSHVHLSVTTSHYDSKAPWGILTPVEKDEEVISQKTHGNEKNADVKLWQRRLNQSGFIKPELKTDGRFGLLTENAVKRLQENFGLDQNGVIDMTTAIQIQAFAHGKGSHRD